jgi:uncharacterized repeat protein (TIGR03803 family)
VGIWKCISLSPKGGGSWDETVLYSFTGGIDGAYGVGHLIFDALGNLYGTAFAGGTYGYGVVFELSPAGANWTETVLYSFANNGDGANPTNGLIMDSAGDLYGATFSGGNSNDGTVYELVPPVGPRVATQRRFCGVLTARMDRIRQAA